MTTDADSELKALRADAERYRKIRPHLQLCLSGYRSTTGLLQDADSAQWHMKTRGIFQTKGAAEPASIDIAVDSLPRTGG